MFETRSLKNLLSPLAPTRSQGEKRLSEKYCDLHFICLKLQIWSCQKLDFRFCNIQCVECESRERERSEGSKDNTHSFKRTLVRNICMSLISIRAMFVKITSPRTSENTERRETWRAVSNIGTISLKHWSLHEVSRKIFSDWVERPAILTFEIWLRNAPL